MSALYELRMFRLEMKMLREENYRLLHLLHDINPETRENQEIDHVRPQPR